LPKSRACDLSLHNRSSITLAPMLCHTPIAAVQHCRSGPRMPYPTRLLGLSARLGPIHAIFGDVYDPRCPGPAAACSGGAGVEIVERAQ
jgi:hypothetical protein